MSTNYCRHVRANGARCRSLALAGETTCYWHHDLRRRHRGLVVTNNDLPDTIPEHHRDIALLQKEPSMAQYYGVNLHGPIDFDLPPLEDREAIQVSLSMVLSALAHNRLDSKRATVLLYGLQVASANAKDLSRNPRCVVRETVIDQNGHELSPDEDPEEVVEARELLQELEEEDERQRIDDGDDYEEPEFD